MNVDEIVRPFDRHSDENATHSFIAALAMFKILPALSILNSSGANTGATKKVASLVTALVII